METTVALGRIAGVRVGVHWSVLVIWWLITWSLATQLLPETADVDPGALTWVTGAACALVLLGCLLAHELSHSVTARRHGVETEAITLWALGGVAQLREDAPSPRTELLVAVAGPATSLALGVAAAALFGLLDLAGAPGLVVAGLAWLAVVNVVLAVFNLLPGFPLDGGRVLHAWLWHRTGSREEATRRAARVGRAFGYGLIAFGVLEFTAGLWGGLWLVFIGWFLLSAASAEGQFSELRLRLTGTTVRDVMTAGPDVVPDSISVQDLLDDHILRFRHSTFPVRDRAGALGGLVTLGQVKRVPPRVRATTAVSTIATPMDELVLAEPDDDLFELLTQLATGRDRRALVVDRGDGDRLVGIVTPTDVTRALEVASLAHA